MDDLTMNKDEQAQMKSIAEGPSSHSCPQCEKKFKRRVNFEAHLKSHEPVTHKCVWCKREYSQEHTLLSHICIPIIKKFKCRVCGLSFHSKKSLDIHVHSGQSEGDYSYKLGQHMNDKDVEPTKRINTLLDEKSDHKSEVVSLVPERKDCDADMSVESDVDVNIRYDADVSIKSDADVSIKCDTDMSIKTDAEVSIKDGADMSCKGDADVSIKRNANMNIKRNEVSEGHKRLKDECFISIKRVNSGAIMVQKTEKKSLFTMKNVGLQNKPDLPIGCSLAEFFGKRTITGGEPGSPHKSTKIMRKTKNSPDVKSPNSFKLTNNNYTVSNGIRVSVTKVNDCQKIQSESVANDIVPLRRKRKVNAEDYVQIYRKSCNKEIGTVAQEQVAYQGIKPGGNDSKDGIKASNSDLRKLYLANNLTKRNVQFSEKSTCLSKIGNSQTDRHVVLDSGRIDNNDYIELKEKVENDIFRDLSVVALPNMKILSAKQENEIMNYYNTRTCSFECVPCKKTFKSLISFHNHRVYHISKVQQSSSVDRSDADVTEEEEETDVRITVIDKGKALPLFLHKPKPIKVKVNFATEARKKSLSCSKCRQKVQHQRGVEDYVGAPQEHSGAGEMVCISRFPKPSAVSSGKVKFLCSCNENLAEVVDENKSNDTSSAGNSAGLPVVVKKEITEDDILFREELERAFASSGRSELQCPRLENSSGVAEKKRRALGSNNDNSAEISGILEVRVKQEESEEVHVKQEELEEVSVKQEESEEDILFKEEMKAYEFAGFDISDLRVSNPEAFANVECELKDVDIVIKEEHDPIL